MELLIGSTSPEYHEQPLTTTVADTTEVVIYE